MKRSMPEQSAGTFAAEPCISDSDAAMQIRCAGYSLPDANSDFPNAVAIDDPMNSASA
jgi:hypothetical protein